MLQQLRLFLSAVQFFTRIPVPAWVGHSAQQLDQSARYFTLVGVCVGGLAAIILWAAALVLPLALAVALSMLGSILITGAFHEDGLSDFVDGMGGGYSRKILAKHERFPRAPMASSPSFWRCCSSFRSCWLIHTGALGGVSRSHPDAVAHAVSRPMAVSIMPRSSMCAPTTARAPSLPRRD
jgi:adenosylcobinamide-GDP ribazoletransferase